LINVEVKDLPPSKSLFNRGLILQSFYPNLLLSSESEIVADDVAHLKTAIEEFAEKKNNFYCGAGAAPLRFLAVRLSREEGSFTLRGTERLFSRPQKDLVDILSQLGCQDIKIEKDRLSFHSSGRWPEKITLNTESTSQILSALMLSSWKLENPIEVELLGDMSSWSYAAMTLGLLTQMGWQGGIVFAEGDEKKKILKLPKGQELALDEIMIEPDMSCIATLAVLGAWDDGIRFWSLPAGSLQGDARIFSLLQEMGVKIVVNPTEFPPGFETIRVEKAKSYKGIEVDLKSTPDLFPVLAVFCSRAETMSKLSGLENLNSKESKRLEKIRDLLTSVGVPCEISGGTFTIQPVQKIKAVELDFDSDEDHRLAMAASLLNLQGTKLKIQKPEVVQKSFPNFWEFFK
jgi:3-phosphoshikimate 1-carboxyvinyltransferase